MGEAKLLVHMTEDDLRAVVRNEMSRARSDAPNRLDTKLMTTQEAAAYCGMSKRAFLHHISSGRLVPDSPARPGFKVHRFKRATLDAFLVHTS